MHHHDVSRILAFVLVCLLVLPAAAAQGPVDPAAKKAQEKGDNAASDPAGFVAHQARPDRVEQDAAWAVAYACHLKTTVEDEAAQPLPDIDQCDDHEAVLGIEEEDRQEEDDVAEVEPVEEDAIATARAVAEDAEATVGRIIDDPGSGADEAVGLIGRTLDALLGLVGGIAGSMMTALGLGWNGITFVATGIADGTTLIVTATADAVVFVVNATIDGIVTATTGTATFLWETTVAIGSGLAWSASALWDGTTAIGSGLGEMVGDVVDAVKGLFVDTPTKTGASGDLLDGTKMSATRTLDPEPDLDALPLQRL